MQSDCVQRYNICMTEFANRQRQQLFAGAEHNKRINHMQMQLVRNKASTPINTVMLFVPQQEVRPKLHNS